MKTNATVSGLISVMRTGLEKADDQVAWDQYCRAEYGKYCASEDDTRGVSIGTKGKKFTVAVKGANMKHEGIESSAISLGLIALALASDVMTLRETVKLALFKADVVELVEEWTFRRMKAKELAEKNEAERKLKAEAEEIRKAQDALIAKGQPVKA